ncbi:diguanylate cyclase [Marichromatium sp. AB31]|nr:diguanylate cyclase [Marichromatium sp. AB31]
MRPNRPVMAAHDLPNGDLPSDELLAVLNEALTSVIITSAELDDDHPKILYVNKAFERMTGYTRAELIGRTPRILQGERTERAVLDRLRRNLERGEEFAGQTVNYRKDGTPYWVSWNITPIRNPDGSIRYFFSNQKDVTEEVRLRQALERERALLAQIIDCNPAMIGISDGQQLRQANAALREYFGIHDMAAFQRERGCICHYFKTLNGRPFTPSPAWIEESAARGPVKLQVECRGRRGYLLAECRRLPDVGGFVLTLHDITDAELAHCRALEQAERDPLTGLLNRRGLDRAMARTRGRACEYATVFIDLDHFKRINDELGHDRGDAVLQAVARVLCQHTRKSDLCARWGGEEFLLVLPYSNLRDGERTAEKLRRAIARESAVPTTASLGVSLGRPGEPLDQTLARADQAVYRAKHSGRNRVACLAPED